MDLRKQPLTRSPWDGWPFFIFYSIAFILPSSLSLFSASLADLGFFNPSPLVMACAIITSISVLPVINYFMRVRDDFSEAVMFLGIIFWYVIVSFTVRRVTIVWLSRSDMTIAFPVFAAAQGVLLAGVLTTFRNPIEPDKIPSDYDSRQTYLQTYLQNWWRKGQFYMTYGLAFGASLVLNIVPRPANELGMTTIAALSVPFGTQIGAILLVVWMKMNYVETQFLQAKSSR